MEQQPPRRSLLILLAVALIVIAVVVVKSLPKEEAAPARPTTADHPLRQNTAAVAEDPARHHNGEEVPFVRRGDSAAGETQAEAAAAPSLQRPPSQPEPKMPPAATGARPEPAPEAEPAAPEPAEVEPKQPVEPLPGSELKQALASGKCTMVDFGAGWCQACKMMDPVLKEAARKYQGKANIVFVDTDRFPQMARDYKIRAIPTQIFFDSSGKEVNRHMGYWPIEEVDKQFAALGVGG